MKIISLELKNFRNYANCRIEFDGGLNVISGKNASGKTNLLESIYVCSVFRSPRTAKDKELVKIGEEYAFVKLTLEKKYRKHTIILHIDSQGKKRVAADGLPINRAGELLGLLGVVFFSPDEMKLIKESPQERRRFLDVGLSQQQRVYFQALQRYNKTLKQKNNLLKDAGGIKDISAMLDVWDLGLAESGAEIIKRRKEYIEKLDKAAAEEHKKLSDEKEVLKLSYETDAEEDENTKELLYKKLFQSREKDIKLGFSTVGPHRDDIKIEINGKDARKFASQGQQRTVALAMKLGEVALFTQETGEPPILLLDDVLSELDEDRQLRLLTEAGRAQTVLTCTEFDEAVPAAQFYVCNGVVTEIG